MVSFEYSFFFKNSKFFSKTIYKRVIGAKLKVKNDKVIRYEFTMPKGYTVDDSHILNGFGVDAGLASFCDASVAEEYTKFWYNWQKDNPNKNYYNDYFNIFLKKAIKNIMKYKQVMGISYIGKFLKQIIRLQCLKQVLEMVII